MEGVPSPLRRHEKEAPLLTASIYGATIRQGRKKAMGPEKK